MVSSAESPQPPCSHGRIHHFPGQLASTESGLLPLSEGTKNNASLIWGSLAFLVVGFPPHYRDPLPSRLFCYQASTLRPCLPGILATELGTELGVGSSRDAGSYEGALARQEGCCSSPSIPKTPRGTYNNAPQCSGIQTEPGLPLFAAVPSKFGPGNTGWGTRLRFAQDKRAAVSSGKRHGATQLQKQSPTWVHKHPQGLRREFTSPQEPTHAELPCDCQPRKGACPC